MKLKKIIICSFVIICMLFIMQTNYANSKFQAQYLKTSDGDTARFVVDGENIRVRFLGINTPEVSGEDKVEEPYGNEALAYTKEKLDNAKKIELEYDDVADKEDRFGRKLCWVWIDGELYELELLEQGLAKTYMLKNNYKYAKELKEAEKKAKIAKAGVWSDEENATYDNYESNDDVTVSSNNNEDLLINSNNTNDSYPNQNNIYTDNLEYEEFGDEIPVAYIILLIVVVAISIYLRNKKNKS